VAGYRLFRKDRPGWLGVAVALFGERAVGMDGALPWDK